MCKKRLIGLCTLLALSLSCLSTLAADNVLSNPGFEQTGLSGWLGTTYGTNTAAHSGNLCYYHKSLYNSADLYQDFYIATSGYNPLRLSTGGYRINFGGYTISSFNRTSIKVEEWIDGASSSEHTQTADSEDTSWQHLSGSFRLSKNAEKLRYRFEAPPFFTSHRLDDTYLEFQEYALWSWGYRTGASFPGAQMVSHSDTSQYIKIGGSHQGYDQDGHLFIERMPGGVGVSNGQTWTSAHTVIGDGGGTGEAHILSGATWHSTTSVYIGYGHTTQSAKTYGEVTVDNATWNASGGDFLLLADQGAAEINIINGGVWNSGFGTAHICGGGTFLNQDTDQVEQSLATININTNGQWNSSNWTLIGSGDLGKGIVNLESGGTWDSCVVVVGYDCYSEGHVNIYQGGTWNSLEEANIGYRGNAQGYVNVDGGTWIASSIVRIGHNQYGYGAGTVTVKNNGNFTANHWIHIESFSNLMLQDNVTVQANGGIVLCDGPPYNNQDLGGSIQGHGTVNVGVNGLTMQAESSMIGTSQAERLTINGDVFGIGTLTHVSINGDLEVGQSFGTIIVDDLILSEDSSLLMEIGGLASGSQHDQLIVNGQLTLNGILALDWCNDFQAESGDTFELFDLGTTGQIIGDLTIVLPTFTMPGLFWDTTSLTTNGTITAVPEPTTLILLAIGGLFAILQRLSVGAQNRPRIGV